MPHRSNFFAGQAPGVTILDALGQNGRLIFAAWSMPHF